MRSTTQLFSRISYGRVLLTPPRVWLAAASLGVLYGSFLAGLFRWCFIVGYGMLTSVLPLFSTWMVGGVLAGYIAGRLPRPAGWSLAGLLLVSLFGLRAGLVGLGVFPLGFGLLVGLFFGRRGAKAALARGLSAKSPAAGDEDAVPHGQSEALPGLQPAATIFAVCGIAALAAFQLAPAAAGTEYYFGDGLGVSCNLRLASNGVFTFRWTGCLGTYDENEGTYQFDNNRVVLYPFYPNVRQGFQGTPTSFLNVKWGGRSYLIPEEKMVDFCNGINQGREPRRRIQGFFYLRKGDEAKPVTGPPSLPAPWREYMLAKPARGSVLAVDSKGIATVSVGRRDGLKPGMVLTATSTRGLWADLQVVSVEEERAQATSRYDFEEEKAKVGDKVSTRF